VIVAIHQPQFLPYLGFFHKVAHSDHYVVLDDVQFMERGFQHRNKIKMQTGSQWLTVPVLQQWGQRTDAVKIDPTSHWRRKHWAALQANYSRAPHFGELAPTLKPILCEGTHEDLLSLDMDLLRWAMECLQIDVPITLSSTLSTPGASTERLVGICSALGAEVYLSGPGGRLYMEMELFERAGIEVRFDEFKASEYPQLFPKHGFIPNLSVVDALFNCGGAGARALIGL
jgi:hypothetical protein